MSLLAPVFLGLAALGIPILLLYMLRMRRIRVEVSSTLLWRLALQDLQANTPWQRLRRNLLLFLQLLILAALVLALARPALAVPSVAQGAVIVLLDASASMNARDAEPNRFEVARQSVSRWIDDLSADSRMTLIEVSHQPRLLAADSNDRDQLHAALSRARVTGSRADWEQAFRLAGAAGTSAGREVSLVVISDGGIPELASLSLPGSLRFVPIGQSDRNLAISALAGRESGGETQLFIQVTNYSSQEFTTLLSVYIDERLYQSNLLALDGSEVRQIVLEGLPSQARLFHARLSTPQGSEDAPLDVLALDDQAYALLDPPGQRRVLLYPSAIDPIHYNRFLEVALLSDPDSAPFRAAPDPEGELPISGSAFDVSIFDGLLPAQLPPGALLIVNPHSNPLFAVQAPRVPDRTITASDHRVNDFVDWSEVHILEARPLANPDWLLPVVRSGDLPLVLLGEQAGRRVAVLSFDLHQSDLPLQISFPILFANLLDHLSPAHPLDQISLAPGDPIRAQINFNPDQASVIDPSGELQTMTNEGSEFVFRDTAQTGIYQVHLRNESQSITTRAAVNLFEPLESNVNPRSDLQLAGQHISAAEAQAIGRREFWPQLGLVALALLLIEWIVYQQGQGRSIRKWLKSSFTRRSRSATHP